MLKSTLRPADLGAPFVNLKRRLTWANEPDEWRPATKAMNKFLDSLQAALESEKIGKWKPGDAAKAFSVLLTLLAEAGQYRHEASRPDPASPLAAELLPAMGHLRERAAQLAKLYLAQRVFFPLTAHIKAEIYPLIDEMSPSVAPDRFMTFRTLQAANIVERLYGFRFRTRDRNLIGDERTPGLLAAIYQRKYLRFGTSGVRGRWGLDFTEQRAKQVVQAICDFLMDKNVPAHAGGENLSGRRIVIGYDSRLNARTAAQWVAQVCLANGFAVDLANRDTPTPALVFYMTDYLPPDEPAALINCTASHNPPEWHGIKFNPRLGYPAATNVTDFIAARLNEIQLQDMRIVEADLEEAAEAGRLRGFDPIDHYTRWVLNGGRGNQRIPIDTERIRKFFAGRKVVVDEFHGAGRGYLTRLLGEIGVQHTVIHAERDPHIPGLDYANPEEPFINALKEKVRESGAHFGAGMDTDADRFGVVDRGGVYFRPNQILAMLVRYLGIDRGFTGRVCATQTGSPLIEVLAGQIKNNDPNKPEADVIPAYVDHPFYRRRVGRREDRLYRHAFMVPVGIKYIEETRRTDRRYKSLNTLPDNWRDVLLIGGEESSGLTTRGHVTDKDGVWANLLIMDMLAYYGTRSEKPLTTLAEIWAETCALPGCWVSYGGREHEGSNSGRSDVDAVLEVKEELINYYLDGFGEGKENKLAGFDVIYAGGVRYDLVELQLRDSSGDDRHYLRIRASGTEPINRIYVESSRSEAARLLMQTVLDKLDALAAEQIMRAHSEWHLADMLTTTKHSRGAMAAVQAALAQHPKWSAKGLAVKLQTLAKASRHLEGRNRRMANEWVAALS